MWQDLTLINADIPSEIFYGADLNAEKAYHPNFEGIKYIHLYSYKKKENKSSNFFKFNQFENLLSLELVLTNVTEFNDFKGCHSLKRLGLWRNRNLQSFEGISDLSNHLEVLIIQYARKLKVDEELFQMKELKTLSLVGISPLESLDFLKHFPKLEKFVFVDTDVLNGDMTPLLEHPTLRYAGYLDKRHYNVKSDEMERLLKEKNGGISGVSK
ncbi:hypothetical protein C772_02498 [Bhargavaea cecembensis DSE10]|uniref:Leucine Rich repeats (2 copies) n=2 Tax=Bhargavaea TaxID=941338 RepID=M7NEA3_9BACL|nr:MULTISPECIES: hypothetical protein [Bhargavaea]EMR05526.1 hypothetical protein C772_02498 [Bhargavaea cecembensis DSE10]SEJ55510.1 hypothetical protein SAMN04488127_2205 [Bhargavaea ginsengi]